MNTINAAAFANSHIEGEIAMRRGHASRSSFKRQGRRQVRHRLAAQLRNEMSQHLAEVMSVRNAGRCALPSPVPSANVFAFPSQEQRAARAVQVIRKVARSPYERQQREVTFLVA